MQLGLHDTENQSLVFSLLESILILHPCSSQNLTLAVRIPLLDNYVLRDPLPYGHNDPLPHTNIYMCTCSHYAPINIMPHYPPYGTQVGINRDLHVNFDPRGGAFDLSPHNLC